MSKHELELVELTNMCMIQDLSANKVLVQVREKNDWNGISFPDGHVELGEPIVQSVIREVKEETGLIITNLKPCGLKDWYDFKKKKRYIVFFYKTSTYSGELISSSHEGQNKWMTIEEIINSNLVASDFLEMLNIFIGKGNHTEFYYEDNQDNDERKRWLKRFY